MDWTRQGRDKDVVKTIPAFVQNSDAEMHTRAVNSLPKWAAMAPENQGRAIVARLSSKEMLC